MAAIVVSGVTGLRNRGVEALVRPTVDGLFRVLPDATVHILSFSPEFDSQRLSGDRLTFGPMPEVPPHVSRKRALLRRGKRAVRRMLGKPVYTAPKFSDLLKGKSLLVATGGDIYSSDYNTANLERHLYPLREAVSAGVPFFLLAQSIGPFKTQPEVDRFVAVARRAEMITVRERISYDYCTGSLGLPAGIVRHTADPGLLLAPSDDRQQALRDYFGVGHGRPSIAFSISQAICSWTGNHFDRHVDVAVKLVQWMIDELKANVVLVPHVQEVWTDTDDRVICTRVMERLNYHPDVKLLGGDLSASDYKAVMGGCDLVVAERMHVAIGALSQAVPALVIGYSIKARGILQDLLNDASAVADHLISIDDFLKDNRAIESFKRAWDNRAEMTAMLKQSLPAAKALAASNFDLIAELVKRQ